MECPYIDRAVQPNPTLNHRKIYEPSDGRKPYIYWFHSDGFGEQYPCQFCQMIGRKRDIFECFNESEWQNCAFYLLRQSMDKEEAI